jgi:hypothetical protein
MIEPSLIFWPQDTNLIPMGWGVAYSNLRETEPCLSILPHSLSRAIYGLMDVCRCFQNPTIPRLTWPAFYILQLPSHIIWCHLSKINQHGTWSRVKLEQSNANHDMSSPCKNNIVIIPIHGITTSCSHCFCSQDNRKPPEASCMCSRLTLQNENPFDSWVSLSLSGITIHVLRIVCLKHCSNSVCLDERKTSTHPWLPFSQSHHMQIAGTQWYGLFTRQGKHAASIRRFWVLIKWHRSTFMFLPFLARIWCWM